MSGYQECIGWLGQHLLSCPSRQWLHMDCPGCGMQRSLLALLQGHMRESMLLHPAAVPVLALLMFLPLQRRFKFRYGKQALLGLQLLAAVVSLGFYGYKIIHHRIFH